MEDRLKTMMQDLGNAINESLSESEPIARAIGQIKHAGYDVFLVLEATIGFNKRQPETVQGEEAPATAVERRVTLTSQDRDFLSAMKISLSD